MWDAVPLFREFSICDDAAKLAKASDSEYLARMREGYDPAAMVASGGSLESFILHRCHGASGYAQFEGKLIAEIAAETGRPVYDSVAAALWGALVLARIDPGRIAGWGGLFAVAPEAPSRVGAGV